MPGAKKRGIAATLGKYREDVYDDADPIEEKLESIAEYVLTLRELRAEDWSAVLKLKRRVLELEAAARG